MQIDDSQFSVREKETIELLLQGKSNKQIALALGVSVSTVEFHLKNVYRKLQVKSRTEAILRLGQSIGGTVGKPRESIVDEIGAETENVDNTISTRRISMKQKLYIIGGGLLVIAMVVVGIMVAKLNTIKASILPQAQNTLEVSVTVTATIEMSDKGTSITLPPGLGDGTQNEIVPQSNEFNLWPRHTKLTLTGYPLTGTMFEPQILTYPALEFAQMSDCSQSTIDALIDTLSAQSFSAAVPDTCSVPDSLPFLPDEHSRQILHAQEKFLSFKNGRGIRYITQYGQAAFPAINNMDIFYTFQGLTNDGKYYVSVILPVNLPYLAADNDPESFKHPADWQNPEKYPDYLKTMVDKLNQPDNQFSPSLESLDALSQSLLISDQP